LSDTESDVVPAPAYPRSATKEASRVTTTGGIHRMILTVAALTTIFGFGGLIHSYVATAGTESSWPQFRFDASNSGYQSNEASLSAANAPMMKT
jgi:hypothetical protein